MWSVNILWQPYQTLTSCHCNTLYDLRRPSGQQQLSIQIYNNPRRPINNSCQPYITLCDWQSFAKSVLPTKIVLSSDAISTSSLCRRFYKFMTSDIFSAYCPISGHPIGNNGVNVSYPVYCSRFTKFYDTQYKFFPPKPQSSIWTWLPNLGVVWEWNRRHQSISHAKNESFDTPLAQRNIYYFFWKF